MLTYTSCGPVINVQGAQKTFEQLIPLQRNTLVVVLYIFHAMRCDTLCLLHFSFHFRSMYILWFYCQFSRESSTIKASRKLKKQNQPTTASSVEYFIQVSTMDAPPFHILLRVFFSPFSQFFLSRISITCDFVILLIKQCLRTRDSEPIIYDS